MFLKDRLVAILGVQQLVGHTMPRLTQELAVQTQQGGIVVALADVLTDVLAVDGTLSPW